MFSSLSLQLESLALKNQEILIALSVASLMCTCINSNCPHNIPQYKKCLFHVKGRNTVYRLSRKEVSSFTKKTVNQITELSCHCKSLSFQIGEGKDNFEDAL